ncbi:hypothetical protein B0H16DRAFT_1827409 [Mycena metata]|uniref:Uncharacterized protein n=1 Tax=Mycena metata TaxID=1033252 RepID=A0AAD7M826_9AGAR|nr:hypothetical protein B0H16DRAFT_1827409 [Mycena metata]
MYATVTKRSYLGSGSAGILNSTSKVQQDVKPPADARVFRDIIAGQLREPIYDDSQKKCGAHQKSVVRIINVQIERHSQLLRSGFRANPLAQQYRKFPGNLRQPSRTCIFAASRVSRDVRSFIFSPALVVLFTKWIIERRACIPGGNNHAAEECIETRHGAEGVIIVLGKGDTDIPHLNLYKCANDVKHRCKIDSRIDHEFNNNGTECNDRLPVVQNFLNLHG